MSFNDYLASPPHQAFATSRGGALGWQSRERTVEDAMSRALERCLQHAGNCDIVMGEDREQA
jgi:hypothetical protein